MPLSSAILASAGRKILLKFDKMKEKKLWSNQ